MTIKAINMWLTPVIWYTGLLSGNKLNWRFGTEKQDNSWLFTVHHILVVILTGYSYPVEMEAEVYFKSNSVKQGKHAMTDYIKDNQQALMQAKKLELTGCTGNKTISK